MDAGPLALVDGADEGRIGGAGRDHVDPHAEWREFDRRHLDMGLERRLRGAVRGFPRLGADGGGLPIATMALASLMSEQAPGFTAGVDGGGTLVDIVRFQASRGEPDERFVPCAAALLT